MIPLKKCYTILSNLNIPPIILRNLSITQILRENVESVPSSAVDLSFNSYENLKRGDPGAPPLIVMHGLFGSKQNWRSLCKAIQQKTEPYRKVIAVDARNHGESPHTDEHRYEDMVEDVVALLKKNNIKKAALLGHSMGGRVMMYLSLKYPELVEKAIFVDISPITSSPSLIGMISLFDSLKSAKIPSKVPPSKARAVVDQHLQKAIPDRSVRDFLLTNLIQNSDGSYQWRVNVDAIQQNFVNNISKFPTDGLKLKFPGPVLFIGGSQSDYIRPSDLPEIKKIFPSTELVMVDGAGHWVHSEKPAILLEHVLEFLNRK